MNNKYIKPLAVIAAILILILTTVVSYAYFTASVNGNSNAYNTVITSGQMTLLLTDGNQVTLDNALPGSSVIKTFKVKNTGTVITTYDVYLSELLNTLSDKNDLVYTLESTNGCANNNETVVPSEVGEQSKIVSSCSINPNIEHEYTLIIRFKEDNTNQDDNKGKRFSAKISVNNLLAKLIDGKTFNEQIKKLVDTSYTYESEVSEITSLQRSESAPSEDVVSTDVSSSTSNTPIKVWYDNTDGTLYYYTKADTIYFNSDSSYSFNNLIGLTSLDLYDFNTYEVTDMQYMFNGLKILDNIQLGDNFDTSNVTNMLYMFGGIKKLLTLDLGDSFYTSNVTNMSAMFNGLNGCININLGDNFDTSKVTDMSWMFTGLQSYPEDDSLNLGNKFDTSNVTTMMGMFAFYSSGHLNLGNKFNISNVKSMYNMFYNAWRIKELDISNFDTSKVENMSGMFYHMINLKTIYVGNKFTTNAVWNSTNMFYNDINLVGGAGTTFNSGYTNHSLARVDDPTNGKPGYFTLKTS